MESIKNFFGEDMGIFRGATNGAPSVFVSFMMLFCGLALFLYGMNIMADGLEASAGSKMKSFLEKASKNRVIGVLTGALVTILVQSSSASTVMVVGFVNAGLLQLAQVAGIIMGANIGTTLTTVFMALNVSDYAPIAVALGVFVIVFAKRQITKYKGQAVAGLGLLFLGMALMGAAMKPLAATSAATTLFEYAKNPFIGLMVGLLFTALIQSSAATAGIVIALAGTGTIGLDQAIFIIYGSNIGTCATAMLASIGTSKTARKVAVMHLLFNCIGSVLFTIITLIPIGSGFVGLIESATGNVKLQISLVHVIFNVTTTLVMLPFANVLVTLANKLIPVKEDETMSRKRLIYLDERILSMPHIIAEQTHKEVERMAQLALENYRLSVDTFLNRNEKNNEKIMKNEEIINFLNNEITRFLVKIGSLNLDEHDRKMIGSFYHILNDLERIGDHAENVMEFSEAFIQDKNMFSQIGLNELRHMADTTEEVLVGAVNALSSGKYDRNDIERVCKKEQEVDNLMIKYKDNHVARLNEGKCSPTSGMLFVNMLSDLERVSDHAKNIATSLRFEKIAQ